MLVFYSSSIHYTHRIFSLRISLCRHFWIVEGFRCSKDTLTLATLTYALEKFTSLLNVKNAFLVMYVVSVRRLLHTFYVPISIVRGEGLHLFVLDGFY